MLKPNSPIKDWDFMTRLFNAASPITLNLEQSEGRQFLFESGYDLRQSTYYAPDGTNLTDHPYIRSQFQKALGSLNLELELNKYAKNKKMLASMRQMYEDIRSGRRADFDARDYYHNIVIAQLFRDAKKEAWSKIKLDPRIANEINRQRIRKLEQETKKVATANILNIYK